MNLAVASSRGNFGVLSQCSSCCSLQFQPFVATSNLNFGQTRTSRRKKDLKLERKRETFVRVTETQTEPEGNNDEDNNGEEAKETSADDPPTQIPTELNSQSTVVNEAQGNEEENKAQFSSQDGDKLEVSSGSPLPGVNPLQLDDSMRLPKETIDILRGQVFGFDTFFVTSQEPYEGGVLFKGNLRGQPATSYEKIKTRMENQFGDQYKLFLLSNPEDDKPVAVVVPRRSLEPETTAVPEWFAAGSFGLVALFTLFLRNVPALQSDLLSAFDNLELLKDGLPGALVTALVLGVHELGHILVANNLGIKLGVPFFVPSWQIGSFGAITRIKNIVAKREDLLKVAAAGPLAGFSLGLILFLLGLFVPPSDGIGVVVDASVFHESFLAGGIVSDTKKLADASKSINLIPVYRCIFSDQLTPVLAYRCLVKEDDREAPSFLFESVEPGSQMSSVGRYSVVGAQPAMEIVAKENKVIVMDHKNESMTEEYVEDPMEIPRQISEKWNPDPQLVQELPDAFCGGWVGFFSYDTVRYVEKRKLPFSKAPEDDRNLPDMHLGLYDDVIVFDHVEKKAYVIHWIRLDGSLPYEKAYSNGMQHLENLVAKLHDIEPPKLSAGNVNLQTRQFGPSLENSNVTCEEYKEAVVKAKEHILAGDIFQIVLSQRFERRTFADPFEVYRALRVVNPSPYMGYLQARGCILVASSPEILTKVKQNKIVNRPLAGTSKRGKNDVEDKRLEKELLENEKQCAEHIMLVDLGRNDVGKVAKYGSVKVEKLMNIERYSHVMHISSTVTGELQDDLTCWDTLRAALPVGTVSGAPKVKAMELIDELEPTRRGPYSGGFGGVSFSGDMDIALSLRTIVFPTACQYNTMYSYKDTSKRREWVAYLQAGAGVVADSDPEDEHLECQNKAAGLARAIDLAESAFVKK